MSNISFHSLELQNYEGWERDFITVELRVSFDIEPSDKSVRLMYNVYNSKNEIIDTLVNGFRDYYNNEFIYPKFDSRLTTDGNIRIDAWLVDTTLIRRYDILSTTGAKEFNRVSNIASRNISLRRVEPRIVPHEKQKIPVFTGTVEGTGFKRGQAYQAPITEGAVISGTKPFETKKPESVFQPKFITLSSNTQNIINSIESGTITVPSWFMNNITWVKSGQITETEFVNAYNFLSPQEPQVTIPSIPEITIPSIPEVSAVMELTTTNFQVKLDNKIQFSSSLSNTDYKRLQDEMTMYHRVSLVFLNQTDFNPLSNFSKILRQIQNLLRGQVVETVTISPTGKVITAPEPTVPLEKSGFMGAGVLGLIGILMLGGFIADHVRKRK